MRMLLTPDQESTLWHFMETITCPSGESFFSMPFYLKSLGGGEYERLAYSELPEEAKDMIQAKNGIKNTTF